MNDQPRGSVFQRWHEEILSRYVKILDLLIRDMQTLPSYPFYITKVDQQKLITLSEAFEVDISGYDLTDPEEFSQALGVVIKKAKDTVETTLRPEDPYSALLKSLDEADLRQIEGGET